MVAHGKNCLGHALEREHQDLSPTTCRGGEQCRSNHAPLTEISDRLDITSPRAAPDSASERPPAEPASVVVRSTIPARLDRLPWTRFHWLVVVGLGVSWILDSLEIQIVSLNAAPLTDSAGSMQLTAAEVGALDSLYLFGEVVGALVFGRITDKLGRRKLFIVTLAICLVGSGLGGFAWDFWSLATVRFIAGLGIGGE